MAVFYYPNRSAPTTTVTITHLESYPAVRIKEPLQSVDELAGGGQAVYDLGGTIEYVPLKIRSLSSANKTSLLNFIVTTCNFRANTFDFTDDQSTDYNTCRFDIDSVRFSQAFLNNFQEDILLRLGPS